jgi:Glyoxalase-like domain
MARDPTAEEVAMDAPIQLVIDCADPTRLAAFWATALGYQPQEPPEGFETWEAWLEAEGIPESEWNSANAVVDPDRVGPRLFFQRVPEPKAVKNRLHLDIAVGGGRQVPLEERRRRIDAEVERLVAAGATRLGVVPRRGPQDSEYCVNMSDPEGNEFDLQ